jgi:cytochrome c6
MRVMAALLALAAPGPGWGQADRIELGQQKFNENCAACHRLGGEGLPVRFPALKNNPFVLGEPEPVISTVLHGRNGKLGLMPAWQDRFTDREVAAIVSYIRQAWGNRAPPVDPERVAELRRK